MNRINEIVKYIILKNMNSVNDNRKYLNQGCINKNGHFNQILKKSLIESI